MCQSPFRLWPKELFRQLSRLHINPGQTQAGIGHSTPTHRGDQYIVYYAYNYTYSYIYISFGRGNMRNSPEGTAEVGSELPPQYDDIM